MVLARSPTPLQASHLHKENIPLESHHGIPQIVAAKSTPPIAAKETEPAAKPPLDRREKRLPPIDDLPVDSPLLSKFTKAEFRDWIEHKKEMTPGDIKRIQNSPYKAILLDLITNNIVNPKGEPIISGKKATSGVQWDGPCAPSPTPSPTPKPSPNPDLVTVEQSIPETPRILSNLKPIGFALKLYDASRNTLGELFVPLREDDPHGCGVYEAKFDAFLPENKKGHFKEGWISVATVNSMKIQSEDIWLGIGGPKGLSVVP